MKLNFNLIELTTRNQLLRAGLGVAQRYFAWSGVIGGPMACQHLAGLTLLFVPVVMTYLALKGQGQRQSGLHHACAFPCANFFAVLSVRSMLCCLHFIPVPSPASLQLLSSLLLSPLDFRLSVTGAYWSRGWVLRMGLMVGLRGYGRFWGILPIRVWG